MPQPQNRPPTNSDKGAEVLRGQQAEALLADPLLAESMVSLEQQYIKAWLGTADGDTEGRERLHMAVQVLRELQVHIRVMIDSGKLARSQMEKLRNRSS